MTGPTTLNADSPGYGALMQTLIGVNTPQAASFNARVAEYATANPQVCTEPQDGDATEDSAPAASS